MKGYFIGSHLEKSNLLGDPKSRGFQSVTMSFRETIASYSLLQQKEKTTVYLMTNDMCIFVIWSSSCEDCMNKRLL